MGQWRCSLAQDSHIETMHSRWLNLFLEKLAVLP